MLWFDLMFERLERDGLSGLAATRAVVFRCGCELRGSR